MGDFCLVPHTNRTGAKDERRIEFINMAIFLIKLELISLGDGCFGRMANWEGD